MLFGLVRTSRPRLVLVKKAPPVSARMILATLLPLDLSWLRALLKEDRNALPTAPVFVPGLLTAKAMMLLVLPL